MTKEKEERRLKISDRGTSEKNSYSESETCPLSASQTIIGHHGGYASYKIPASHPVGASQLLSENH